MSRSTIRRAMRDLPVPQGRMIRPLAWPLPFAFACSCKRVTLRSIAPPACGPWSGPRPQSEVGSGRAARSVFLMFPEIGSILIRVTGFGCSCLRTSSALCPDPGVPDNNQPTLSPRVQVPEMAINLAMSS